MGFLLLHPTKTGIVSPDGLSSLTCSLEAVRGHSAVLMYPAELFFEKVSARQKIRVSEQQQKRYMQQGEERPTKQSAQSDHSNFALISSPSDAGAQKHLVTGDSWLSMRQTVNDKIAMDNNHARWCAADLERRRQQLTKQENTYEPGKRTFLRQFSGPHPPEPDTRPPPTHVNCVPDRYSAQGSIVRTRLTSGSNLPAAIRHGVTARPNINFTLFSELDSVPSSAVNKTPATAARSVSSTDQEGTQTLRILPHASIIPPGVSTTSVEVLAVPGSRDGGSQLIGSLLFTATYFDRRVHTLVRGSGLIAVNVTVPVKPFQGSGAHSS